ncbi:hypothetical protein AB833_24295 [Chromatiales bacterium (ex Bugula neritina AB1)]|nr:hypothetical protein AB833_24295 [Chromatiales bacterium (ex Bugula neritina AB1)]
MDSVIFDMDGLLIDTERFSQDAFERTVQAFNLDGYTELFLSLVGTNEEAHRKRLSEELDPHVDSMQFRQHWIDSFHQLMAEETVPLLDGVQEALEWLQQHKIKCAVATSTGTAAAEKKLVDAGIRDFFLTVTCGDQVTHSKPHPEIYIKAGQSIGADISRSIGMEDSPNGVRSALGAGLSVIQIPNLVQPDPDLLALGHRVCASMREVIELMERGAIIP